MLYLFIVQRYQMKQTLATQTKPTLSFTLLHLTLHRWWTTAMISLCLTHWRRCKSHWASMNNKWAHRRSGRWTMILSVAIMAATMATTTDQGRTITRVSRASWTRHHRSLLHRPTHQAATRAQWWAIMGLTLLRRLPPQWWATTVVQTRPTHRTPLIRLILRAVWMPLKRLKVPPSKAWPIVLVTQTSLPAIFPTPSVISTLTLQPLSMVKAPGKRLLT